MDGMTRFKLIPWWSIQVAATRQASGITTSAVVASFSKAHPKPSTPPVSHAFFLLFFSFFGYPGTISFTKNSNGTGHLLPIACFINSFSKQFGYDSHSGGSTRNRTYLSSMENPKYSCFWLWISDIISRFFEMDVGGCFFDSRN